jgi:hypothetical protein
MERGASTGAGDTVVTTHDEMQAIADAAAEKAVRHIFQLLGVDTADQNSINKFRADLVSARQVREFREATTRRFWMVVLGIIIVGAISALWTGIKLKMGG